MEIDSLIVSYFQNTSLNFPEAKTKITWSPLVPHLPLKVVGSAEAWLRGGDPGVILGQHATVPRPTLHIDRLLTHHTRLSLPNNTVLSFPGVKAITSNTNV